MEQGIIRHRIRHIRVTSQTFFKNQSINFIDERVKTTTDIVTKINTNYATIKQIQQ